MPDCIAENEELICVSPNRSYTSWYVSSQNSRYHTLRKADKSYKMGMLSKLTVVLD